MGSQNFLDSLIQSTIKCMTQFYTIPHSHHIQFILSNSQGKSKENTMSPLLQQEKKKVNKY